MANDSRLTIFLVLKLVMTIKKVDQLLLGVVFLGLFFRVVLVFKLPIWLDESFVIRHLQLSTSQIIKGLGEPVHPFGYYFFLKVWSVLSSNLLWLRSSTIFLYLGNIYLMYLIGKKLKTESFVFFLITLYSFSGYFLIFDWQARMYTGVITLILASWFMFISRKSYLFLLLNVVGLYFDYAFIWYMLPLTLFLFYLYFNQKSEWATFLKATLISWLVFALWLPVLWSNYFLGLEGISWIVPYTKLSFALPYFLGTHKEALFSLIFLMAALVGIRFSLLSANNIFAKFFIIAGIFSGLISYIVSLVSNPIFHVRNLQIVGLMFLISLAIFCDWLWKSKYWYFLSLFLLIYLLNFWLVLKYHFILPGSLLIKFIS